MSHVIRIPDDIWESLLRTMPPQDGFSLWMNAELYPDDDPENQLIEIPDDVWDWAVRQSGQASPDDVLLETMRHAMRDNP